MSRMHNNRRLALAGSLAAVLTMGVSQAGASIELTAGDKRFIFSSFSAGTTGYSSPGGPFPVTVCESIGECDDDATAPAPDAVGSEDTWGIANIRSIEFDDGTEEWGSGDDGSYLHVVFGGLADFRVDQTGEDPETFRSLSQGYDVDSQTALERGAPGGFLRIYENDSDSPYVPADGPGNRGADPSEWGDITDGDLWLEFEFTPGITSVDPDALFLSNFDEDFLAGSLSRAFLSVTGGSQAAQFNNDAFTTEAGVTADAFLEASLDAGAFGWTTDAAGDIETARVEVSTPATLGLFGLGLMLLGWINTLRRRV